MERRKRGRVGGREGWLHGRGVMECKGCRGSPGKWAGCWRHVVIDEEGRGGRLWQLTLGSFLHQQNGCSSPSLNSAASTFTSFLKEKRLNDCNIQGRPRCEWTQSFPNARVSHSAELGYIAAVWHTPEIAFLQMLSHLKWHKCLLFMSVSTRQPFSCSTLTRKRNATFFFVNTYGRTSWGSMSSKVLAESFDPHSLLISSFLLSSVISTSTSSAACHAFVWDMQTAWSRWAHRDQGCVTASVNAAAGLAVNFSKNVPLLTYRWCHWHTCCACTKCEKD